MRRSSTAKTEEIERPAKGHVNALDCAANRLYGFHLSEKIVKEKRRACYQNQSHPGKRERWVLGDSVITLA